MGNEHNALKYFPNLARLGERGFGIDDNEQSITRMSETLQGVADLWSQQEWAVYRGEVWFGRLGPSSPAVAARNSAYELVNQTTNNTIAVVRLLKALANGFEVAIAAGPPSVANSVQSPCSALDSRVPIAQVSQCGLFSGDLAAPLAQPQDSKFQAAGVAVIEPNPSPQYIIVPGFKLQLVNRTQNQAFQAMLVWTERPAFPGELSR